MDNNKWKPGQLITRGYKLCRVKKQSDEYIEDYKRRFSHLPRPLSKLDISTCYLETIAWNIKHPTVKKFIARRMLQKQKGELV